jgi:DNA-binding response OmpR family regulator
MEPTQDQTHRILVVDDDPFTLSIVEHLLGKAGYRVLTASSGQEALDLMSRHGLPTLAIVDINMPGMNGLEFCRIVQEYSDLPIIMLTAVNEEETIIQAIERHAEDYIRKPFSPGELLARVRRLLRRIGDFAYTVAPITRIDDRLQVDFANRLAYVEGEAIPLTPIETKLLYILLRNSGRTVMADFLIQRLWPFDEAFKDRLRVHIYRLRQKIERAPGDPQYVVSDRGSGYTLPNPTGRDGQASL